MSCGVGFRRGSDPMLLWLWRRLEATAPIRPLLGTSICRGSGSRNGRKTKKKKMYIYICIYVLCILSCIFGNRTFFFGHFRSTPVAYEGSQARSLIRAVAAGLHHSHSNAGSKLHLQPTPQPMATLDPYLTH